MPIIWDDLQLDGLGIYRDTEGFAYGQDAVLLANFAKFSSKEHFVDLGAGGGILSLLIWGKSKTPSLAVDIDPRCTELIKMSAERNGLSEHIIPLCADMRGLQVRDVGTFDGAVCNPPYFEGGTKSENASRLTSRFQDSCTLGDAVQAAKRLVKNGGNLFICYPAEKVAELCFELVNGGFQPKRMRFVRSTPGKEPYLVLVQAKKGGGCGCKIEI